MVMSRIRIFAGLLALGAATPALAAGDGASAPASTGEAKIDRAIRFTTHLTNDATVALTASEASDEEKLVAFQGILAEGLALDYIGRIMLGEARKSMSEDQLARYQEIFPAYMTRQYAEQFSDIVGRPLEVVDSRAVKKDIIVRTQFNRETGDPIKVDWRVRERRDGEQKILDIIVSGVSIMLVKREEFASFIAANGVNPLLERLESEAHAAKT